MGWGNKLSINLKVLWIIWVIVILIGVAFPLNYVWIKELRKHPSEEICQNLVDSGYLSFEDCIITSEQNPSYISHYFPTGIVSEDYVRSGMSGFEIYSEGNSKCHNIDRRCSRVDYLINRKLIFDETYEFFFVDGKLTSTVWHN